LSGMPHITDQLWQSVLPVLYNAKWVSIICLKQNINCIYNMSFFGVLCINWQ
jgi:hypothetical protein